MLFGEFVGSSDKKELGDEGRVSAGWIREYEKDFMT